MASELLGKREEARKDKMCGGDHGGELGCGGLGKEDVEMGKKLRGSQDVGSEEVADRTVFV